MKGHKSSQELCEIIIRMLPLLDTSKIMAYTGASKSTIEKIAQCYQLTGKPYKESRSGGRARIMDLEDIETSSVMRLAMLAGKTCHYPRSGERFIARATQGRRLLEKRESGMLINVLNSCIGLASSIGLINSYLLTRAP
ncbi:hypothetical protein DFJ58DRAFT_844432 [Suillus subalutaceus]|uniref:uncharacterized protein n=1 Tax=Suillus subalutaceus TaxID=48586 RepID=UPI001B87E230|nr:uncharacterized protein DFJ58DRAFT_844432 [Suillus subalutaceus]KAG1843120.1 hypothetical protein DFJ58DRAFT_844432 [Suillus subalutaceus]